MPERANFLATTDLLADAPRDLLHAIAGDLEAITRPKDTRLFEDDAKGDAVYFIRRGRIGIEKGGITLLERGPGEAVGEMALIDDAPRSAAAVALSDVEMLVWHRDDFLRAITEHGVLAYKIARALTARLRDNLERETEAAKVMQDRERAAEIQRAMLPAASWSSEELKIEARCRQADDVGGDYFDYIPLGGGRVACVIADVQGHGIQAALLVALAKSSLRTQIAMDPSPGAVLRALNRAVVELVEGIQLMTCFYGILDPSAGGLRYASAGHIHQYVVRADGELERLSHTGLLLGVPGEKLGVEEVDITWTPGNLLTLFTDGLTEAENVAEEQFGDARVQRILSETAGQDLLEVRERLRAEVETHRGGLPFTDDVTLLLAQNRAQSD